MIVYRVIDLITYQILNFKIWYIFIWFGFITFLSLYLLFTGEYTTDLYYATLVNLATPVIAYIAIQYYKRKYMFK